MPLGLSSTLAKQSSGVLQDARVSLVPCLASG